LPPKEAKLVLVRTGTQFTAIPAAAGWIQHARRMQRMRRVEIPQKAFLAILDTGEEK
jgi:hypothetical protein